MVLGQERIQVDFVNLRAEAYAQHSRIPHSIVSPGNLRRLLIVVNLLKFFLLDVWKSVRRCPETRHHHQCPLLQHSHARNRGLDRDGLGGFAPRSHQNTFAP